MPVARRALLALLVGAPCRVVPAAATRRQRARRHKNIVCPVPLHAPWRAGQTWQVITFYGEDGHSDATRDYYAVDWKPVVELDNCHVVGAPVLAPAAGVVTLALTTDGGVGSGGKTVFLQLAADPTVTVHFEHLDAVVVRVGQHVTPPQPVGTLGETGLPAADCAHLHMGVRRTSKRAQVSIKPGPLDGQAVVRGGVVTSQNG